MRSFLRSVRKDVLLMGVLAVVLGAVLLIWPGIALRLVGKLVGAGVALYGAVSILGYLVQDGLHAVRRYGMFYGIALVLVGVFLFRRSGAVASIVPMVFGIALLVNGLSEIQSALDLRRMGDGKWWLALLPAAGTLILGGVMAFNPFGSAALAVRVIGICLIYQGISHLLVTGRVTRMARSLKEELEQIFDKNRPVETHFTDEEK